jgi:hypothetical protein
MTEIKCSSVAQWILQARNAGRKGQLLLSEDDPCLRLLGFLNVDTDEHYVVGLTAVKDRAQWGTGLPPGESWESIQMSVDIPERTLSDLIRTPPGRALLALRLSGRVLRDKEVAEFVSERLKAER